MRLRRTAGETPATSRAALARLAADRSVAVAAALLVCSASFALGAARRGVVRTDPYSERVSIADAEDFLAGRQSFGIMKVRHYPNGPTYALAAMMRLGVDRDDMRLLPVAASALALGFMAFALLRSARDPLPGLWSLAACTALAVQPGIADWQGALHEHSYVVAILFAAVGFAAWAPARWGWLYLPLGFVAGWTGFDWLPAQSLAVLGVRWLAYDRDEETGAARAALLALLDAMRFAAGVSLAILAHLLQLALYFGSLEQGVRDLIGSAAVRMGSDAAATLNPGYADWLRTAGMATPEKSITRFFGADFSIEEPTALPMLAHFFRLFLDGAVQPLVAGAACALAALLIAAAVLDRSPVSRRAGAAAGGVLVALAASTVWTFLMPHHAVFHAHILFRHPLAGLTLFLVLPALLARPAASLAAGLDEWGALRRLAVYAATPAATLGVFAWAFFVLGAAPG